MWSQMKGEGEPVADGRPQSPRCGRLGGDLLRGTQEPGAAEPTHRGSCWGPRRHDQFMISFMISACSAT